MFNELLVIVFDQNDDTVFINDYGYTPRQADYVLSSDFVTNGKTAIWESYVYPISDYM